MLEIKNLTKIYKAKGGADVKALDDVSIRFGETGLVFLLGKSGSGKSTLLNLAGGLDEPTSGEVVVMGKSSKDFSGSDFDSYRNTYVGFVFQEYNVLNEFNVEENVALALELQGKTREKDKVRQILDEVELGSFAKRKPNTLSGGQKQRIAIARALVKDPQIIMADEPTGALDSATGKQVFDTLKKLSATRLVLVVSHDRDFAEEYGDRIVELKDGKIISDVIKTREKAEEIGSRVKKIGEDTLSVKAGEPDGETMRAIADFLKEGSGEILLSKGEQEIRNFKRVNRIGENGERERFVETDESAFPQKEYGGTKFIRSRLPVGKAVKIGASGLKLKPFRLILTIFLSLISFTMFGLSSTMMFYNGEQVLVRSFLDSGMEYVTLEKSYHVKTEHTYGNSGTSSYEDYYPADFTPAEVEAFSANAPAIGAYELTMSVNNLARENDVSYYIPILRYAAYAPQGSPLREGLVGKYPSSSDEICISRYFSDCMRNLEFYPVDEEGIPAAEPKKLEREEDVLGQTLLFGETPLTVTGIFDGGTIPQKYERVKALGDLGLSDFDEIFDKIDDYLLYLTFNHYISEGLHALILTGENFREAHGGLLSQNYGDYTEEADSFEGNFTITDGQDNMYLSMNSLEVFQQGKRDCFFFDENKTQLSGNEIVIPDFIFQSLVMSMSDQWGLSEEDFTALDSALDLLLSGQTEHAEEAKETIRSLLKTPLTFSCGVTDRLDEAYSPVGTVEIAGILTQTRYYMFCCSQEFYDTLDSRGFIYMKTRVTTNYTFPEDAEYTVLLVPSAGRESDFRALLSRTGEVNEDDVIYGIGNLLARSVSMANDIVGILHTVFLVLGIVLALFSSLLLFNFISMSITNKRKEIGILRAVGARGTDVFKIFFSESGIIVGICTVLALIGTAIATVFLNGMLRSDIGLDVSLFVFGIPSIAIMIGVALLVAFLATFLPVYFAAKKKPVESIRAL